MRRRSRPALGPAQSRLRAAEQRPRSSGCATSWRAASRSGRRRCWTSGAATVRCSPASAERWPDVRLAGLDLQPERIDEARVNAPDAQLLVGSADALPFDDHSFDVVTAITLMSSLPTDPMEIDAAREIARVTRPGGWLVWFDLRYDNPTNPAVHGIDGRRLADAVPGVGRRSCARSTVLPPLARRLGRSTPSCTRSSRRCRRCGRTSSAGCDALRDPAGARARRAPPAGAAHRRPRDRRATDVARAGLPPRDPCSTRRDVHAVQAAVDAGRRRRRPVLVSRRAAIRG